MSSLKTPLRYPGGKSRAVKKMAQFFPNFSKFKSYREPFIGGGSVALYVTQMYPDLDIWVNDLYEPLVNFWKQLRDNGKELQKELSNLKIAHPNQDSARCLFIEMKGRIDAGNDQDRAVAFYVVNKCSFSGLTQSSSFSAQASDSNFSMRGIEKLVEYSDVIQDWKITNKEYQELYTDSMDTFTYLDPPYAIGSALYGKKGGMHKHFDHEKFFENCDKWCCPMMVSYNSANEILERFIDWDAQEYDHTYTMRSVGDYMKNQQERKELLLLNYAIR